MLFVRSHQEEYSPVHEKIRPELSVEACDRAPVFAPVFGAVDPGDGCCRGRGTGAEFIVRSDVGAVRQDTKAGGADVDTVLLIVVADYGARRPVAAASYGGSKNKQKTDEHDSGTRTKCGIFTVGKKHGLKFYLYSKLMNFSFPSVPYVCMRDEMNLLLCVKRLIFLG